MDKLYVKSPSNGYWILVGGPTYRQLEEEGYILNRLKRFTREEIQQREKTSPTKKKKISPSSKKTTSTKGKVISPSKKRGEKKSSTSPKKSGDKGILSDYGYSTKISSLERHYSILSAIFEHGGEIVALHLKIRADQNRERNPKVAAIMDADLIWVEKELAQDVLEQESMEEAAKTVVKPLRRK